MSEIAAIVADSHHADHNQVAGALLAAHRADNGQASETAMVLLLAAARPLVLVLDPSDRSRTPERACGRPSSTGSAASTPTPSPPARCRSSSTCSAASGPYALRHPSEPVGPIAASDAELEVLLGQRHHDPDQDVPGVAIARLDLAAARQDRGWADLTRYAAAGRNRSGIHPSRIARHRQRLAESLGYVA